MGFYNTLSRKFIGPATDLLLQRSIFSKLEFLEESQWWDRETILKYQNDRLRRIVNHAYQEIPFYRKLYDHHGVKPGDVDTVDDLKKLPVIQKKDIREIAASRKERDVRTVAGVSSGSTGEPLQYSKSVDAYSMHTASGIRGWQWMGFNLGDKYIKVSQNPRSSRMKQLQDVVNRSRYVFFEEIDNCEFEKLYQTINHFRPRFLRCYPDPLDFFSRFLQKKGYDVPPVEGINTTGNILYPEARERIEETFQTTIYDSYSCEGGAVYYQAEKGEAYSGADEYAITEIVNSDENDVSPDENGRLITTDLWNTEVPFIRYDTQDIVTKGKPDPSSGRSLTRIDKIDGRDCDILVTPNGKLVIVHIFTIFFEHYDSIDQFQVIQESRNNFTILLVVNERFSKKDMEETKKYWTDYFGEEALLEIDIVDSIPARNSGKRRFLVRDERVSLPI